MAWDNSKNKALEEFLKLRGISSEVIHLMKYEKIDVDVISHMQEQDLTNYISAYGDRVAIIEFAKRKLNSHKEGLVEKLRKKILKKRKSEKSPSSEDIEENKMNFTEKQNKRRSNNCNAIKENRLILVGWLCEEPDGGNFKQVRLRQGGGTRRVVVPKTSTVPYIINKGIDIFFPDGKSKLGDKSKYSFELWDFQRDKIDDNNLTVEEIFALTKMATLRVYLASKLKFEPPSTIVSDKELLDVENDYEINNQISVTEDIALTENFRESDFYNENFFMEEFNINDNSVSIELEVNTTTDEQSPTSNEQENTNLNKRKARKLLLHRGQCFKELLDVYANVDIADEGIISVDMFLPNGEKEAGEDTGGIFRDAITEFFRDFYEICTVGTAYKVPVIRHDFDEIKWCTVAKLILLSWKQEKMFPVKIAPVFMEQCLYGVPISPLKDNFLKYVSPSEAEILQNSLDDFDNVDKEELINILETYQCRWSPTKENIHQLIIDIAHTELIQKPTFVINCWRPFLKDIMFKHTLRSVYLTNTATAKNILKHLKIEENLNCDQSKCVTFFKKFIREADDKVLGDLLRFCTGCDMITQEITITFNRSSGLSRLPIGHTCGCILELPTTYENYQDFRSEFNNVLASNVWVMDAI